MKSHYENISEAIEDAKNEGYTNSCNIDQKGIDFSNGKEIHHPRALKLMEELYF